MNPCALHNVFSEYVCYLADESCLLLVGLRVRCRRLGDIGSDFSAECWSGGQSEKITATDQRNNDQEELVGHLEIV